jgi:multiple sugar transport system permease protein
MTSELSTTQSPVVAVTEPVRHRGSFKWGLFFHYLALIILSFIIIFPIYVMFITSFKTQVDILASKPVWFFVPTLSHYEYIIKEQNFGRILWNSIVVGIGSTIITLIAGGMGAFAIARMKFRGRGLMAQTTLIVRMVPPAVLAVPIFALWLGWGIEDGRIGLVLFYNALNLPFTIWLLVGFVRQIPVELEEAAIVDGAGPFQVFFRIIFPLMRSGFAVAAIFVFRISWNEFILALILTNRLTRTLPVAITLFLTEQGIEWGRAMAMGTLIVLPPLIITFIAARQIIAGLTAGAVKG